jgi:hypothetical protein
MLCKRKLTRLPLLSVEWFTINNYRLTITPTSSDVGLIVAQLIPYILHSHPLVRFTISFKKLFPLLHLRLRTVVAV